MPCQATPQQQHVSQQLLAHLPSSQQQDGSSTIGHPAVNLCPPQSSPFNHRTWSQVVPAMPNSQTPLRMSSPNSQRVTLAALPKPAPAAGLDKESAAAAVVEKRSPVKGSNAWPPPSPSPKKGLRGRSQNRAPTSANGLGQPDERLPGGDPIALHSRLRCIPCVCYCGLQMMLACVGGHEEVQVYFEEPVYFKKSGAATTASSIKQMGYK